MEETWDTNPFIEKTVLYRHVAEILLRGYSSVNARDYDKQQQVLLKLDMGIKVRKLDGLKSAILMLYTLRQIQRCKFSTFRPLGDNFLSYIMEHLSPAGAVAIVEFGLQRRLLRTRLFFDQNREVIAKFNAFVSPATVYWAPWHGQMAEKAAYNRYRRMIGRCKNGLAGMYGYVEQSLAAPESPAAFALLVIYQSQ